MKKVNQKFYPASIPLLLLFLALIGLFPLNFIYATSTGGATNRAVVIDGIVNTGGANGSNSVNWENDEVFEGFSTIVNWYMTWDDTNLYLGRTGGNNAEGSVIYILAGYPGADDTVRAFDYDGLRPELSAMGGLNFAAYFRDTYDEYRTYNAGWSPANTGLNPLFSNQPSGNQMEVVIPWQTITGGNGKPDNFRAVMYQIVQPGATGCPGSAPFVYGESPWGTGLPGDGPNLGVNDGQPTSARQPGGCGVENDPATRWWGCYPVIAGVGANGWAAVQASAGVDTTICETATAYVLQGNTPGGTAVGTWSNISQPGGAPAPNILGQNDPGTIVQGLVALGTYSFSWDINYNGCPSIPDTVEITRIEAPPFAEAGLDQDLACDISATTLNGTDPMGFNGLWTLVSGSGVFNDPDSFNTAVTGLAYGPNVFRWSITNGACPAATDTVTIWRYQPVNALAGFDQELCNQSMAMLNGINTTFFGGQPIGNWQQIGGPGNVSFADPGLGTTSITGLQAGTYDFTWTITNGTCPSSTDTTRIIVYEPPFADAGGDLLFCEAEMLNLLGNNPAALGDAASGVWRQSSGPVTAIFKDSTLYNTEVSGLEPGEFKFLWIVGNGNCPLSSDVVTVTISDLAEDGFVQTQLASAGENDGVVEINAPQTGTAPFEYSLDGINFQSGNSFTGLSAGTYLAYIQDVNGCETTLTIEVLEENTGPPDPVAVVVPTGFSPNGDNVNDQWLIENASFWPELLVEVYNGWGQLLYRSEGAYTPWNGTYNGQDLPAATYYFIVDPRAEGQEIRKGALTIFR